MCATRNSRTRIAATVRPDIESAPAPHTSGAHPRAPTRDTRRQRGPAPRRPVHRQEMLIDCRWTARSRTGFDICPLGAVTRRPCPASYNPVRMKVQYHSGMRAHAVHRRVEDARRTTSGFQDSRQDPVSGRLPAASHLADVVQRGPLRGRKSGDLRSLPAALWSRHRPQSSARSRQTQ